MIMQCEAGIVNGAKNLLFNLDFLLARARMSTLSSLLTDIAYCRAIVKPRQRKRNSLDGIVPMTAAGKHGGDGDKNHGESLSENTDTLPLKLLHNALVLTIPSLGSDVDRLPGQLAGRLQLYASFSPEIAALVRAANEWQGPDNGQLSCGWWFPLRASLIPARGICTAIIPNSHDAPVDLMAWGGKGQRLCTASSVFASLCLWNVNNASWISLMERSSALGQRGGCVSACTFSPCGRFIAAGYRDGTICLFDLSSREGDRIVEGHMANDAICAIAFSLDGKFMATGGERGEVKLWTSNRERRGSVRESFIGNPECPEFTLLCSFTAHCASDAYRNGRKVAPCPSKEKDGEQEVSSGEKKDKKDTKEICKELRQGTGEGSLISEKEGQEKKKKEKKKKKKKKTGGKADKNGVRSIQWEMKNSPVSISTMMKESPTAVTSLHFNSNNGKLCSTSSDKTVKLFLVDVAMGGKDEVKKSGNATADGGQGTRTLAHHKDIVWDAAWSPNAVDIVSASNDGTLILWKLARRKRSLAARLFGPRDGKPTVLKAPSLQGVPFTACHWNEGGHIIGGTSKGIAVFDGNSKALIATYPIAATSCVLEVLLFNFSSYVHSILDPSDVWNEQY